MKYIMKTVFWTLNRIHKENLFLSKDNFVQQQNWGVICEFREKENENNMGLGFQICLQLWIRASWNRLLKTNGPQQLIDDVFYFIIFFFFEESVDELDHNDLLNSWETSFMIIMEVTTLWIYLENILFEFKIYAK